MPPHLSAQAPLLLPYDGVTPQFATPLAFCGAGASILGKVTLGANAVIGQGVVIRADGHFVRCGDNVSLGRAACLHIAHEILPAVVGDDVAIGCNSVVHACTVGNRCAIEDDVVVLDGAVVDDDIVIEAGSTVFPRARLESGFVYAGSPAKPTRALQPGERAMRAEALRRDARIAGASRVNGVGAGAQLAGDVFVAATARLAGNVHCAAGASIFFGCDVDAAAGAISIGANTNVQDNSILRGAVTTGDNTTIGHNVSLSDCSIGAGALIGIGSVLAEGSRVGDDVLLAGGSTTLPHQQLDGGRLWAGRPARNVGKIDDAKRGMMKHIVDQYRLYAGAYTRAQNQLTRS